MDIDNSTQKEAELHEELRKSGIPNQIIAELTGISESKLAK